MAVTATHNKTRLSIVLYDGVDPDTGKDKYKTKSFNNIRLDATPDELLQAFVDALVPLQQRNLYAVEKNDHSILRES
ncbi:DUF1659 domain-containing protein [Terribacillus saccharophilus]|uniref:DUF1659 domain-containing protein n=1 Tax=Terribacillus saccharophilus TaxID=361277 RepID=UPI0029899F6A|nr:DUF1659 domain-containing protein [Terribacillus saccharophilus]MCM3225273.1 DUF1659 domain-containing protein [Terribacillus saccharophilus]